MGTLQKFSRKVVVGLAVVSLIVVGISGLIYTSISQLIASSGWVAHSYQVLDTLDLTENYFVDAQSSERGYVATCKQALITPFRRDVPLIFSHLATLQALTADNPAQLNRTKALNAALNDELSRMTDVIATNLNGNLKSAESMLDDDANVHATRNVLAIVNAMETEERGLLATRLHDVRTFAFLTLLASAAGTLACFAILVFVFWLIRRETKRRAQTEASLQDANGRLEGSLTELKHYNVSTTAISLLAELLQTCRGVDEALSICAAHLSTLLPGANGTIGLFNNSRDTVEVTQTIGNGSGLETEFPADACWSLRRGRAHVHSPHSAEPLCAHLTPSEDETVLCLPMFAQGDTLGVLTIGVDRPGGLTGMERQTIQTITEQLSLAVANLKLQETLRFQSLRDQLTGLFNRRYLGDALPREFSRAKRHGNPISAIMIDIDHFKQFNDTYGHEGGDALLAAFGQLLVAQARGEDIACRYGGEEFALIMPGADAAAAAHRANELCEAARRLQVTLHGRPLGLVTMSAGVAGFPAHGDTGEAILASADRALYRAKESGRNRVVAADERHAVPTARAS